MMIYFNTNLSIEQARGKGI